MKSIRETMARKENRIIRKRIANAYLSSVVSISLVLLLIGIGSMLLVNTESVSNYFKENMTISVMMRPEVTESQAIDFTESVDTLSFVHSAEFISRERGEEEMVKMLGEDFLKVFETSPIPVSVNLTLNAAYVSPDSVKLVEKKLMDSPLVEEVVYQQSLIDSLNANLSKISLVIAVFIGLLMFISYVLISNTMRLSFYDKRFTVHTMKLVGATRSFIRAPFLMKAAFMGLFSSVISILMLVGILYFVRAQFSQLFEVFRLDLLLVVMGIVVVAGLVICIISTFFVVNRLLSLGKDELYY